MCNTHHLWLIGLQLVPHGRSQLFQLRPRGPPTGVELFQRRSVRVRRVHLPQGSRDDLARVCVDDLGPAVIGTDFGVLELAVSSGFDSFSFRGWSGAEDGKHQFPGCLWGVCPRGPLAVEELIEVFFEVDFLDEERHCSCKPSFRFLASVVRL